MDEMKELKIESALWSLATELQRILYNQTTTIDETTKLITEKINTTTKEIIKIY